MIILYRVSKANASLETLMAHKANKNSLLKTQPCVRLHDSPALIEPCFWYEKKTKRLKSSHYAELAENLEITCFFDVKFLRSMEKLSVDVGSNDIAIQNTLLFHCVSKE